MYVQHFAEFTDQASGASMVVQSTTPANLIAHQTGATVVLKGTNTTWVSGVTGFNVSGMTGAAITGTVVNNGAQTATLTITTSTTDASGTLNFTNTSDPSTASAPVLGNASTYSFAGPSNGTVSVPSTNFTVAYATNTADPSAVIVTPSDGGGGGSFSPTTVTLTADTAAASATFTYTPGSTGVKTISVTNNGGLSNPSNLTYTSNPGGNPGQPNDPNLTLAPAVWRVSGTSYLETIYYGAYIKFNINGSTDPDIAVQLDMSPEDLYPLVNSGNNPAVGWSIDFGAASTVSLTGVARDVNHKTSLVLARSLAAGQHTIHFWIQGIDGGQPSSDDRWLGNTNSSFSPATALRVAQFTRADASTVAGSFFTASVGAALSATYAWPYPRSKKFVFFGDSITQAANNDLRIYNWTAAIADLPGLDAEWGAVAFGGISWTVGGQALNTPGFTGFWDKYSGSFSRLDGNGHFIDGPYDAIFINVGTNNTNGSGGGWSVTSAQAQTMLNNLWAANSNQGKIFLLVPFGEFAGAGTAFQSAVNAVGNPNILMIDWGAAAPNVIASTASDGQYPFGRSIRKDLVTTGSLRGDSSAVHPQTAYLVNIAARLGALVARVYNPTVSGGVRRGYQ